MKGIKVHLLLLSIVLILLSASVSGTNVFNENVAKLQSIECTSCTPWQEMGCGDGGVCPKNYMVYGRDCSPPGCPGPFQKCEPSPKCQSNKSICGNGVCESGENIKNCPQDCNQSICRNGQTMNCTTTDNCPGTKQCVGGKWTRCVKNNLSCGTNSTCGNNICDFGENSKNCPQDCKAGCKNGEMQKCTTQDNCKGYMICRNNNWSACKKINPLCGKTNVCGNGICERGENWINCRKDCPRYGRLCKNDSDCTQRFKCVWGVCRPSPPFCKNDSDCPQTPYKSICVRNICKYSPPFCKNDSDCPSKYRCVGNICRYLPKYCKNDRDCPKNSQCIRNICVPKKYECVNDKDCPNGKICVKTRCRKPPVCGDGICEYLEMFPASSYYCPKDCKKKTGGNIAPVADFDYFPLLPKANENVLFDASKSNDPDGRIVSYQWVFGDGFNGSGIKINHSFDRNGTFSVTLIVKDNNGAVGVSYKVINVGNGNISTNSSKKLFELRSGWNIVHYIAKNTINADILRGCGNFLVIGLKNGKLTRTDKFEKNKGYLIRVEKDCKVMAEFDIISQDKITLNKGWNIVGFSQDIPVDILRQICPGILIVGLSNEQKLYLEKTLVESGNAYLVRVRNSCEINLI